MKMRIKLLIAFIVLSSLLPVFGQKDFNNYINLIRSSKSGEAGIRFKTDSKGDFVFYTDNTDQSPLEIRAYNLNGEDDGTPRISIPQVNKNLYLALSGGRVGIGTNNTQRLFHLKSSTESPYMLLERSARNLETGLEFRTGDSRDFIFYVDNTSESAFEMRAEGLSGEEDGAARLTMPRSNKNLYLALSGGNVGIGTSSVNGYKLAVNGSMLTHNISVGNNSNILNINASTISFSGDDKTVIESDQIKTVKIVLSVGSFPDYVFDADYNLMPLNKVDEFIKENKHLPNMPSEKEVVTNGMSVGEINVKLVEKIEELTLYILQQEKKINRLIEKVDMLELQKN
jgi:hypothetical protein